MKGELYLLLRSGVRFGFLKDKVGTDIAKKEPKSTSRHSWLETHERLNLISSDFKCLIGLPSWGSSFLKGLFACPHV
jgi:hypothetical protein